MTASRRDDRRTGPSAGTATTTASATGLPLSSTTVAPMPFCASAVCPVSAIRAIKAIAKGVRIGNLRRTSVTVGQQDGAGAARIVEVVIRVGAGERVAEIERRAIRQRPAQI